MSKTKQVILVNKSLNMPTGKLSTQVLNCVYTYKIDQEKDDA